MGSRPAAEARAEGGKGPMPSTGLPHGFMNSHLSVAVPTRPASGRRQGHRRANELLLRHLCWSLRWPPCQRAVLRSVVELAQAVGIHAVTIACEEN